jgi:hypothetical protein
VRPGAITQYAISISVFVEPSSGRIGSDVVDVAKELEHEDCHEACPANRRAI